MLRTIFGLVVLAAMTAVMVKVMIVGAYLQVVGG